MKKYLLLLLSITTFTFNVQAQQESPYKTSVKVDLPITLAGVGLSGLGVYYISEKKSLTPAEVSGLSKNDVNQFDRFSAGYNSESAKNASDIPFYGSFIAPLGLLLDNDVYQNAPQVFLLYGETMAITGTLFAMTAGLVNRYRPLAYGLDTPADQRRSKNARNAFFAGHVAATGTATFFLAKVFNDFNPDSPAKPLVWGTAAAVPALVGYLRIRAGKHFLSDVITGYAVGTTVGILVPHLHKKTNLSGISVTPTYNRIEGRGVALAYTF